MTIPEYLETVRSECGMTREEAARVPPETVQLLLGLALRIAIAEDMPQLMRKAWTQAMEEASDAARRPPGLLVVCPDLEREARRIMVRDGLIDPRAVE